MAERRARLVEHLAERHLDALELGVPALPLAFGQGRQQLVGLGVDSGVGHGVRRGDGRGISVYGFEPLVGALAHRSPDSRCAGAQTPCTPRGYKVAILVSDACVRDPSKSNPRAANPTMHAFLLNN